MLIAGFEGLEPPDYILEWLAQGRIGGVILFSRNIDTPEQVAQLTQKCHEATDQPILIGIDQEGGVVARLREGFTESPGAMALGAANSEALAEQMAYVMATELRALGINWTYAPVVDVTHNIQNASVGTRSPGVDKDLISRLAVAQIKGFQRGGVAATAKHFPGLGNTPVDTHDALAVISESPDYLYQNDLVPFRVAVDGGVSAVMTTHVKFTALDADHPTTLSSVIIPKLLREEIGFDGLVATDCMEMKAITDHYGPAESAVLAAIAGIDIIHFSHTREYQEQAYDALLEAAKSGRIPQVRLEEANRHIQAFKDRYKITAKPDTSVICSPEHLKTAEEAARAGTVLVRENDILLPLDLNGEQKIGLVEFASYLDSGVMDRGGETGFVSKFKQAAPQVESVSLKSVDTDMGVLAQARQLAETVDTLVLATRNAHLIPQQHQIATELMEKALTTILVCLRNPFDVDVLPGAVAIICTLGDSNPSQQAAIDALLGKFTPTGKMPVILETED